MTEAERRRYAREYQREYRRKNPSKKRRLGLRACADCGQEFFVKDMVRVFGARKVLGRKVCGCGFILASRCAECEEELAEARESVLDEQAVELGQEWQESPEREVWDRSDAWWLLEIGCSRVSSRQRAAIQHLFFDGLTLEEAGVLMRCSRERVRQLKNSALIEFREVFRFLERFEEFNRVRWSY